MIEIIFCWDNFFLIGKKIITFVAKLAEIRRGDMQSPLSLC